MSLEVDVVHLVAAAWVGICHSQAWLMGREVMEIGLAVCLLKHHGITAVHVLMFQWMHFVLIKIGVMKLVKICLVSVGLVMNVVMMMN